MSTLEDPHALIQDVWGSLKSIADWQWGDEATVHPGAEGETNFTIRTSSSLNDDMWRAAKAYIRLHGGSVGWELQGFKKHKGYVSFSGRIQRRIHLSDKRGS